MREILFRGKRVDNGEWVYGYYARKGADKESFRHNICVSTFSSDYQSNYTYPFYLYDYEVDPSTIEQYTGLTDKNGKKIFEGDIVHYIYDSGKENGWKVDQNSIIKWDFSGFYMDGIFGSNKYACRSGWLESIVCNGGKFFEVIGNIHDNPELLKGANK